jgi:hypothetical protein
MDFIIFYTTHDKLEYTHDFFNLHYYYTLKYITPSFLCVFVCKVSKFQAQEDTRTMAMQLLFNEFTFLLVF